jgi:hypothetical protein
MLQDELKMAGNTLITTSTCKRVSNEGCTLRGSNAILIDWSCWLGQSPTDDRTEGICFPLFAGHFHALDGNPLKWHR